MEELESLKTFAYFDEIGQGRSLLFSEERVALLLPFGHHVQTYAASRLLVVVRGISSSLRIPSSLRKVDIASDTMIPDDCIGCCLKDLISRELTTERCVCYIQCIRSIISFIDDETLQCSHTTRIAPSSS
jgi:hypothetical protein